MQNKCFLPRASLQDPLTSSCLLRAAFRRSITEQDPVFLALKAFPPPDVEQALVQNKLQACWSWRTTSLSLMIYAKVRNVEGWLGILLDLKSDWVRVACR